MVGFDVRTTVEQLVAAGIAEPVVGPHRLVEPSGRITAWFDRWL